METESAVRVSRFERVARIILLVVLALMAATSALGGVMLIFSPVTGDSAFMPLEMLEGSGFSSYVLPGIILFIVVGGTHALAFRLVNRRHRFGPAAACVAGFGILIWIFVQMVFIPFSVLQIVYFGFGLLELGLVLLLLDVFGTGHARDQA